MVQVEFGATMCFGVVVFFFAGRAHEYDGYVGIIEACFLLHRQLLIVF
jgi:hypothetical protein